MNYFDEKNHERAMEDLNPDNDILDILYDILGWLDDPGLNIIDIKALLQQKIFLIEN